MKVTTDIQKILMKKITQKTVKINGMKKKTIHIAEPTPRTASSIESNLCAIRSTSRIAVAVIISVDGGIHEGELTVISFRQFTQAIFPE